ncbi:hypothetical protein D8M30_08395 [Corynebacterium pseudodiphtheriticum]|nr:hypothetical protein D8M17_09020 [Corynebacterium pseudodiphtheriticum]RUQ47269.1 hypothetical protein D8M30_08395 [Corynebacterium pseudodiphtheriticum]
MVFWGDAVWLHKANASLNLVLICCVECFNLEVLSRDENFYDLVNCEILMAVMHISGRKLRNHRALATHWY